MSSPADENALLVAVAIASQDAASRIQAATVTAQTAADAEKTVANTNASAQRDVASTEAGARTQVASIEGGFEVQVANIQAGAQESVANIEAAARESVATTEAGAQTTVASTQANAEITAAQAHANAVIDAAVSQANATTVAATTDANARTEVAQIESTAQQSVATIDAGARTTVANTDASASNYSADKQFAGVQAHETAETARLNLKLDFADDKWKTLLPVIQSAVGTASGGSGGGIGFHASTNNSPMGFAPGASAKTADAGPVVIDAGMDSVGHYSKRYVPFVRMGAGDVKTGGIGFGNGSSVADATAATQLPYISTSGVLTPAQIQQQVNANYARNDAKATSEFNRISQVMAGRGFASNSPISQALQVGLVGQALRASIQGETQIRIDSAKANADTITTRQKNLSDQFLQQEQLLIDGERVDVTRTVGVLQAVSQLIGSVV